MKRWLIWFSIGVADLFLFIMGDTTPQHETISQAMTYYSKHPSPPMQTFLALIFGGWLVMTVIAVPIGVLYWLVKGRAS